jgi:hypothetical protein
MGPPSLFTTPRRQLHHISELAHLYIRVFLATACCVAPLVCQIKLKSGGLLLTRPITDLASAFCVSLSACAAACACAVLVTIPASGAAFGFTATFNTLYTTYPPPLLASVRLAAATCVTPHRNAVVVPHPTAAGPRTAARTRGEVPGIVLTAHFRLSPKNKSVPPYFLQR